MNPLLSLIHSKPLDSEQSTEQFAPINSWSHELPTSYLSQPSRSGMPGLMLIDISIDVNTYE